MLLGLKLKKSGQRRCQSLKGLKLYAKELRPGIGHREQCDSDSHLKTLAQSDF